MAADGDKKPYRVSGDDDHEPASGAGPPDHHGQRLERSGPAEPLPLEDELDGTPPVPPASTPRGSTVKALDVCPSCGADMPGSLSLVCVRCGFNLKTLKTESTATDETAPPDEEAITEEAEPLSSPGRGGLRLPGFMAAGAGCVLAVGYLAGASALYLAEEVPGAGGRFAAVWGELVMVGAMTGCGVAALALVARYSLQAAFGDVKLAALRVLGAVVSVRLLAFLSLPLRSLELPLEAAAIAAAYTGLLIYFFVLGVRDAAVAMFVTFMLLLTLVGVSAAVYGAVF